MEGGGFLLTMLTMLGSHMTAVLNWGAGRERRRGRVVLVRP